MRIFSETHSLLKLCLKAAVTILIFALLIHVYNINLQGMTDVITPSIVHILILLNMFIVVAIVSTFRWQILLRCAGIEKGFGELFFRLGFGNLINLISPGGVMGDLVRGLCIDRATRPTTSALGSVFMDRISGLFGALIIFWIALYASEKEAYFSGLRLTLLVILSATVLYLIIKFLSQKPTFGIKKIPRKLAELIYRYVFSLTLFKEHPLPVLLALLLSIVITSIHVLCLWYVSRDIGLFNLHAIAIGLSLSFFTTLIPISIGGLGTREATFIVVLTSFGVSPDESVAISLVWFFGLIISTSFIAGSALLFYPSLIKELELWKAKPKDVDI